MFHKRFILGPHPLGRQEDLYLSSNFNLGLRSLALTALTTGVPSYKMAVFLHLQCLMQRKLLPLSFPLTVLGYHYEILSYLLLRSDRNIMYS